MNNLFPESYKNERATLGRRGFSLIELLIVMAMVGILSVAVGVYINSAATKTKTFVFNLSAHFKQAKFLAITHDQPVYLDFDFNGDGVIDNGFAIWQDNTGDAAYDAWVLADNDLDGDGICSRGDDADCLIQTVVFDNKLNADYGNNGPEIYDGTATGGPDAVGGGPNGVDISGGVTAADYRFRFLPNGDCQGSGYTFIYFPEGAAGSEKVAAGPWAIKVSGVGRISIDEWQSSTGTWKVNK